MASVEQLKGMADLLVLQQRLRQVPGIPELSTLLVNDTRLLFPYRTAVLWSSGKIVGVSGLPEPVRDAPFSHWLIKVFQSVAHEKSEELKELKEIKSDQLPTELAEEWEDYLPAYALWIPLLSPENKLMGVLLLARDITWKTEEKRILSHWAGAAGHGIEALNLKRQSWWHGLLHHQQRKIWAGLLAIFFVVMLIPVRISIIAPAEIVPADPLVVRAPLDGVIGEVLVQANQSVEAGQAILNLDDTSLLARLDIARQELEVAKAEHLRAEQASIVDRNASAQVFMLNSRIEQRTAEVDYVQELLDRIDVRAEQAGIAMIDDITELKGRPVAIGEQILIIADPINVELEAWLPVDDGLPLGPGAEIKLYLNIAPGSPVPALVERIHYQAQVSPEGILAFRIRAEFVEDNIPRIGLRGSARIYGEKVPLYYFLLRKPLAALRQIIGF